MLISTEAVVLSSQRLGEADKLVTLFTLERGKVRAVAQGARRMRSRFGASLEPLTHGTVILFERKPGLLLRLNQASILHPFPGIRRGLPPMMAAGRMARLVSMLMPPGEANNKVYALLLRGLFEIEKGTGDFEIIERFFDIHLLKYAGYLPRVDQCVRCRGMLGDKTIYFSADGGGTICPDCRRHDPSAADPVSRGTLAFLLQSLRMGWDGVDRLKAGVPIRGELRRLADASFSHISGRSVVYAEPAARRRPLGADPKVVLPQS